MGRFPGQLFVLVALGACQDPATLTPVDAMPIPPGPPPLPDCDDGNPCTADHLDAESRTCRHEDLTGPCELDDRCLSAGQCSSGRCVGIPVVCEVPSPCHQGTCDPDLGCVVEPVESRCDDDDPCTIDRCTENGCTNEVVDDGMPCAGQGGCTGLAFCQAGLCQPAEAPDGYPCDDGNPCTIGDSCQSQVCMRGEPAPASGPAVVDRFLTFGAPGGGVAGIDAERLLIYDSLDGQNSPRVSGALTVVRVAGGEITIESQTFGDFGSGHRWESGPLTPLASGKVLLHGPDAPAQLVLVDEEGGLTLHEVGDGAPISFAALAGHVLFVGWVATPWEAGQVQMIDISDPSAPVGVGDLGHLAYGLAVDAAGERLFVTNGEEPTGITVYDVTDPEAPVVSGSLSMQAPGFITNDPFDASRLLLTEGGKETVLDAETLEPRATATIGGWAENRQRVLRGGGVVGWMFNDAGPSGSWYWPSEEPDPQVTLLAGTRFGGGFRLGATADTLAVMPDERNLVLYDLQGDVPEVIDAPFVGAPGLLVDVAPSRPPVLARPGRVASIDLDGVAELGLRWEPDRFAIRLSGDALGTRSVLLQTDAGWLPGGTRVVRANDEVTAFLQLTSDPKMRYCSQGPDEVACFLDASGVEPQIGLYALDDMIAAQPPVPHTTFDVGALSELAEVTITLGQAVELQAGWLAVAETASFTGSIAFYRLGADGEATPAGRALHTSGVETVLVGEDAAARVFPGLMDEYVEVAALDPATPSVSTRELVAVPGAHKPIWIGTRQVIVSTSWGLQWIDFRTDPPALTYELTGVAQDARSMVHHAGLLYAASDHDVVVLEPACAGP